MANIKLELILQGNKNIRDINFKDEITPVGTRCATLSNVINTDGWYELPFSKIGVLKQMIVFSEDAKIRITDNSPLETIIPFKEILVYGFGEYGGDITKIEIGTNNIEGVNIEVIIIGTSS